MKLRIGALLLFLAVVSMACGADIITLTDGSTRVGVVSRILMRDSVELVLVDEEVGGAQIQSIELGRVAKVDLEYIETALFTLVLNSGDIITGVLLNSPFDDQLEFVTLEGAELVYATNVVSEVRLAMRHPTGEPLPSLRPSFGFGSIVSQDSISVTQEAIAWFSPNWMLVASIGIQYWWEPGDPSVGVINGLTYLHKQGRFYWGVGTTTSFNMTKLSWHSALQFRLVIPLTWTGRNSFLSFGVGVLGD